MKNKMLQSAILFIMITVACMLLMAGSAFAAPSDSYSSSAASTTSQKLITVTRPESNDSTFKESYFICGQGTEGVTVYLLFYDESAGRYVDYKLPDSSTSMSWTIGPSGVFYKEIRLKQKGVNKFRLVAVNSAGYYYISDVSITLLDNGIMDIIKGGIFEIDKFFKNITGQGN